MYGCEVVIPTEVQVPFFGYDYVTEIENDDAQTHDLDMVDEVREQESEW